MWRLRLRTQAEFQTTPVGRWYHCPTPKEKEDEMTHLHRPTRRQFVSTATALAGAALLPKSVLANPALNAAPTAPANEPRPSSREKIPWKVEPFPLRQVRLRKGPFQDAQEADRRYLH